MPTRCRQGAGQDQGPSAGGRLPGEAFAGAAGSRLRARPRAGRQPWRRARRCAAAWAGKAPARGQSVPALRYRQGNGRPKRPMPAGGRQGIGQGSVRKAAGLGGGQDQGLSVGLGRRERLCLGGQGAGAQLGARRRGLREGPALGQGRGQGGGGLREGPARGQGRGQGGAALRAGWGPMPCARARQGAGSVPYPRAWRGKASRARRLPGQAAGKARGPRHPGRRLFGARPLGGLSCAHALRRPPHRGAHAKASDKAGGRAACGQLRAGAARRLCHKALDPAGSSSMRSGRLDPAAPERICRPPALPQGSRPRGPLKYTPAAKQKPGTSCFPMHSPALGHRIPGLRDAPLRGISRGPRLGGASGKAGAPGGQHARRGKAGAGAAWWLGAGREPPLARRS